MSKFPIKISEIIAIDNRLRELNRHKLEDIDFMDDEGNVVPMDEDILHEWKMVGLNNAAFITKEFYLTGMQGWQ
jgi:hypothetical protein